MLLSSRAIYVGRYFSRDVLMTSMINQKKERYGRIVWWMAVIDDMKSLVLWALSAAISILNQPSCGCTDATNSRYK